MIKLLVIKKKQTVVVPEADFLHNDSFTGINFGITVPEIVHKLLAVLLPDVVVAMKKYGPYT